MSTQVSRGIGGAPNRASTLPTDGKQRKLFPVASGVLDYFPDALVDVSGVSHAGNEQHNPGQPLNWARGKSSDESDTMIRHFLQRGSRDTDGLRHSAKMAWRALAILQKEIEADQKLESQSCKVEPEYEEIAERVLMGTVTGHILVCNYQDRPVGSPGCICNTPGLGQRRQFPSLWHTVTAPSQKDFCTDPGDVH